MRDAGTIRFPPFPFCEPKQENAPQHPPHLFRCPYKLSIIHFNQKQYHSQITSKHSKILPSTTVINTLPSLQAPPYPNPNPLHLQVTTT